MSRIKTAETSQSIPPVSRIDHYSIHPEHSSVDWIMRFFRFHHMRSRDGLFPAESEDSVGAPTLFSILILFSNHTTPEKFCLENLLGKNRDRQLPIFA